MKMSEPSVIISVLAAILTMAVSAAACAGADNLPGAACSTTSSVAAADVNRDGILDVVVVNSVQGTVEVMLGKGNGTFVPATSYRTGSVPLAVCVADVNRDGIDDLVVANQFDGTVSILLGKGDGTFRPKTDYGNGVYLTSLAVGDLNHDGRLDIVTGHSPIGGGTGFIQVLLGSGDGKFRTGQYLSSLDVFPGAVAVADINRDGKPDLIVSSPVSGMVSVYLGKGDGTLVQTPINTGSRISSLAVGDLNHDGILDLVGAEGGSNSVTVLYGKGDGTFRLGGTYGGNGDTDAVAIADVNRDGLPDLVFGSPTAGTISIRPGVAGGGFGAKTSYNAIKNLTGLVVADLNRDGRPDMIAGSGPSGMVSVLLGNAAVP